MREDIWYRRYDKYYEEVFLRKQAFETRCERLGIAPIQALNEIRGEMIVRAVRESNWLEGIQLDEFRTRELTIEAFMSKEETIKGPRLDVEKIVRQHQQEINEMINEGTTLDEIATYNLSSAYWVLDSIGLDLTYRYMTPFTKMISESPLVELLPTIQRIAHLSDDQLERLKQFPLEAQNQFMQFIQSMQNTVDATEDMLELIKRMRIDTTPVSVDMTGEVFTYGEWYNALLDVSKEDLRHRMYIGYVHLIHHLTMTGMLPAKECGAFREIPVHIANPNVSFPDAAIVPQLMQRFCSQFPTVLSGVAVSDPIQAAADTLFNLICIHPYTGGNGRVARLLVNLVLWSNFPSIALKAERKGRKKYRYAFNRSFRTGNTQPLACVIAMSLISAYDELLQSM